MKVKALGPIPAGYEAVDGQLAIGEAIFLVVHEQRGTHEQHEQR